MILTCDVNGLCVNITDHLLISFLASMMDKFGKFAKIIQIYSKLFDYINNNFH